jgi:hypothetical protein
MDHDRANTTALLEQRLMLIASLSSVNAEALKANQMIGGLHMEIQRVSIFEPNEDEGSADDILAETRMKLAEAEAVLADCAERIDALEVEVAEIDRHLGAAT